MVPLEAQACGRPVIAYGAGGSLETVSAFGDEATGAYFAEQTADSAVDAITRWEQQGEPLFRPRFATEWAAKFATPVFLEHYRDFVLGHVPEAAAVAATVAEAAAMVAR